eukprot:362142-Chlamydomonas_euryale.AAC.2
MWRAAVDAAVLLQRGAALLPRGASAAAAEAPTAQSAATPCSFDSWAWSVVASSSSAGTVSDSRSSSNAHSGGGASASCRNYSSSSSKGSVSSVYMSGSIRGGSMTRGSSSGGSYEGGWGASLGVWLPSPLRELSACGRSRGFAVATAPDARKRPAMGDSEVNVFDGCANGAAAGKSGETGGGFACSMREGGAACMGHSCASS